MPRGGLQGYTTLEVYKILNKDMEKESESLLTEYYKNML